MSILSLIGAIVCIYAAVILFAVITYPLVAWFSRMGE